MKMKILVELLKSIKESNDRLDEIEDLLFKMSAVSRSRHGAHTDITVPISEEIYEKICKEIGSGSLFFMAIA
tara:strand:- start:313 stop:528 length:216 start_codon:yes stop_codon:yes gene_type:complete